MARSYIAVSTDQPVDNIAVRIVRSRWWKRTESGGLHVDYEVLTGAGNRNDSPHVQHWCG
jgi:hypothetical protein